MENRSFLLLVINRNRQTVGMIQRFDAGLGIAAQNLDPAHGQQCGDVLWIRRQDFLIELPSFPEIP
ncbi:MAG: hypothetical protein WAN19_09725, partial [Candidatus Sulfotelmatobacter sp.]